MLLFMGNKRKEKRTMKGMKVKSSSFSPWKLPQRAMKFHIAGHEMNTK